MINMAKIYLHKMQHSPTHDLITDFVAVVEGKEARKAIPLFKFRIML